MKSKFLLLIVAIGIALPTFGQDGATKRVAILETVDRENVVLYGVKLMVRSKLAYAITNTPGYEGYDRVDIASIMNEQDFQRTGLVDDSQIKRLGVMTGADYILVPELAKLDNTHIIIVSKILNVETAKLEKTSNIQTATDVEAMEEACRILAARLLGIQQEIPSIYTGQSYDIYTDVNNGELIIDGNKYVGEYRNGRPHGKGRMTYQSDDYVWLYYDGDWVDGIEEGMGTVVYKNGNRYEGGIKNGTLDGMGVYYWVDGDREEAFYIEGVANGPATLYSVNGNYENRVYKDNVLNGPYTFFLANGDKRVGTYVNGKAEGSATYYFANGDYATQNWVAGKVHGVEDYYHGNGDKYKTYIYDNGVLKKKRENIIKNLFIP